MIFALDMLAARDDGLDPRRATGYLRMTAGPESDRETEALKGEALDRPS